MDDVKDDLARRMTGKLREFVQETEAQIDASSSRLLAQKVDLKTRQREQRQDLRTQQQDRADQDAQARAARFRKGLGGVWDWLSGKTRKLREQNEREFKEAATRDTQERDTLIATQLSERRVLQRDLRGAKRDADTRMDDLRSDLALYLGMRRDKAPSASTLDKNLDRPRLPGREL